MNTKGYYRFSDVGMFILCFTIVGITIGIGIYIFYSSTIDLRSQEAKILYDKLIDGIVEDGKLKKGILLDDFDIYESAGLDKKIIVDSGKYYFKIEIFSGEQQMRKLIIKGAKSFEVDCLLPGKKFPKCYPKRAPGLIIVKDYEEYRVKVWAGANQLGGEI